MVVEAILIVQIKRVALHTAKGGSNVSPLRSCMVEEATPDEKTELPGIASKHEDEVGL